MKLFTKINIEIIPNDKQRYKTVGDFWIDKCGVLQIRVSDLGDPRFAYLVAVHELIEVLQTEYEGIKEEDIKEFDEQFEYKRMPGNLDEPGDDPKAPYKKQHCIATAVERLVSACLNVDWKDYERACNEI